MSIHLKIVWLFIGVAILPLLVFAGVARHQSLTLADFAAEAELISEVREASTALAQEVAVARATLQAFAGLSPDQLSDGFLARAVESGAGPQPSGFAYLALLDEDGEVRASAGATGDTVACRDGRYTSLARAEAPLEVGSGRLVGRYWTGLSTRMAAGTGTWVYDVRGRLLAATSCGGAPPVTIADLPPDSLEGVVAIGAGAEPGAGSLAFSRVGPEGWTAVATGTSLLREPVARFFRDYWLFVLVLAATTLLAFSFLLRAATGSLEDLTRAAERVAAGDLRPWLPTPRDDEIGRLTLAFSEMTDRLREMVNQVDRTGRLAVLGKLSAYLAHEIRNPLSAVKMNLQRLQRWQRKGEIPERCGEAIEVSLNEVGRLAAAVSNILQLAPGKPAPRAVVSVHGMVEDAAKLLKGDFSRRGVALRWELNAEGDRVLGQEGQLKGVIINLMLNALDAQPQGGELLIRSTLRSRTPDRPGPRLELRFRDRGPGVPPEIRERIFEPFFTTKELGSGIGLAVASQTIRDHGGDLFLEDRQRVDEGAEFVVSLPLAAAAPEGELGKVSPQVAPWLDDGRTSR